MEAELAAACCERDALRLRMAGLMEEFAKAAAKASAAQAETVQTRVAAAAAAAEARTRSSLRSCCKRCHLSNYMSLHDKLNAGKEAPHEGAR